MYEQEVMSIEAQERMQKLLEAFPQSAYTRFFDTKTGEWIEAISEPKIDPNHFRIHLKVEAFAPCKNPLHRIAGVQCDCPREEKELIGVREGPTNLCTNAFAAFVQSGILSTAPANTVPDTGNTARTLSKEQAHTALTGRAGTSSTAAAVTDYHLITETETQASVTVNANPTTGTTSGTFTVTFTITAGADRLYTEVGLTVVQQTWTFLITRDVFTGLNVSNTGTLAVTYTFTNS